MRATLNSTHSLVVEVVAEVAEKAQRERSLEALSKATLELAAQGKELRDPFDNFRER